MKDLVIKIQQYCTPSRFCYRMSSYGLKELFEGLSGEYISNDQFKTAMIEAGFTPTKATERQINHRYRIVLKSRLSSGGRVCSRIYSNDMADFKYTTHLEKYALQVLSEAVRTYIRLVELPQGARHRKCVLTFTGDRFRPVDIRVHFVKPKRAKNE